MKKLFTISLLLAVVSICNARTYRVDSPDGKLYVEVNVEKNITWSVTADGRCVIAPSEIAITLSDGSVMGQNAKVRNSSVTHHRQTITTPLYKKSQVEDIYNLLTLNMGDYSLQFRAYDDGAAYRFVSDKKGNVTVMDELAEFNFEDNYKAFIPYVNDNRSGERYSYSFESYYDEQTLNDMYPDSIAVTPLLVDLGDIKAAISDFGIDDYPGMFLKTTGNNGLIAEFAPVPIEGIMAGFNELNFIPTKRADYIAGEISGKRALPWRAVIVAREDRELASCDMDRRLSNPSRIDDISWIVPGKVSWDWWNNLHVYGVDFKVGRNTETYKYFIDFAKNNELEYIIVDEGWSDANSILTTIGDIDIKELVDYGNQHNVGVILWASWKNVHRELEEAMKHYADMGVAGFKIDFFDADDQNMVRDMARFAQVAADNHLLLDYHGMKANGMQVTYPNILNFEGVKGLENYKWSSIENDPPKYAVTAPFIRTLVGPMDYTPGAMTNADTEHHRADNDNPMSEGTRANQLAMYVVYDAPLQMLADSPTRYTLNQECTDIIDAIPTVFDETIIVDGKVGEYIITARRAGDTWYVGAMTNRSPRDLKLDFSFLPEGAYMIDYVCDGINTNIDASDHIHAKQLIINEESLNLNLASAGGFVGIIRPLENFGE